jgi:hypothetical protein
MQLTPGSFATLTLRKELPTPCIAHTLFIDDEFFSIAEIEIIMSHVCALHIAGGSAKHLSLTDAYGTGPWPMMFLNQRSDGSVPIWEAEGPGTAANR